jgi:protein phosphatase
MQTVIAVPHIDPNRRILVTSDIHGHAAWLKNALAKADFGGDDLLIVVGDFIEKGPAGLETVRTVMELCQKGMAMATVGNVDKWRVYTLRAIADHGDREIAAELYDFILNSRKLWGSCFYEEMAAESGCPVDSPEAILAHCRQVMEDHKAELDFLDGLPTVLTAGKYIFVHGGLPSEDLTEAAKEGFALLKRDWYLREVREKNLRFDPYVVVGHYPVSLYRDAVTSSDPLVDTEHHVICIDGGCGLKSFAQLDLLILPSIESDGAEVTWISCDGLPPVRALEDQDGSEDSINLHWGDCEIRPLEAEGDCTLVEHIRTGRRLWIPTDYLYNGGTRCEDATDRLLPVQMGDTLYLIRTTDRGYIVKKNGIVGWYHGRIEPLS